MSSFIYTSTPDSDNWVLKKWLQDIEDHHVVQSEITCVWIDDAKQLEDSKKKHKPKQQMPYWAVNWRKK